MLTLNLPPDYEPVADGEGKMTPEWRAAFEAGATLAGYGVPTGALVRNGFATYSAPAISGTYASAQLQIQALANHVEMLSGLLAALITDVRRTA